MPITFTIEGFVGVENAIVSRVSGWVHLERVNMLKELVCLNHLNQRNHQRTGEQMTVNLSRLTRKTTRVLSLFVAILVLGWAFGRVTHAGAQKITPPITPGALTPPAGNSAFLLGHAVGTQGYVCLPTSAGASTPSWTVDAARPEATLFVNVYERYVEVVTHSLSPDNNPNEFAPNPLPFGSPTWQTTFDSSKVWGQSLHNPGAQTGKGLPVST
jgi:Protein of unknown function (DUF3455)